MLGDIIRDARMRIYEGALSELARAHLGLTDYAVTAGHLRALRVEVGLAREQRDRSVPNA